jgi:signal transduction histidine kinase
VIVDIPPNASNLAVLAILYTTAAYGTPVVRWIGFASTFVGALVVAASIALPMVLGPLIVGDLSNVLNLGSSLAAAVLVFLATLVAFLLSWTSGLLVRTWLRARDSRRAAMLAEQEVAAEQERTRIARDMHDVVAHSLAVVVAQADGARYIASKDPAATEAALVTISTTAREALSDVRVLLAQLRHSQEDGPQRTLVDLERLYEQLQAAGLTITEQIDGEPLQLGTAQQLAVYRIVQESLTNALRHADTGEPATVHFGWTPHGLNLTVSSALKPPTGRTGAIKTGVASSGHGLAGMTERALLVGGHLTAKPESGRFLVRAWLPAHPAPHDTTEETA